MQVLTGLLYINEVDVYATYGAFLTETSAGEFSNYSALLKPPRMKPYVAVDFREDNGEKLPEALPDPAYEARDVTLYFAIMADTSAQFMANYTAFLRFLMSGWLEIRLPELGKTYKMYYKTSDNYEQLTPIDGKVVSRFKVTFREPEPTY